jgi:hypothetical protein
MGQAKRRGTFEQRKAEGIARAQEEKFRRQQALIEAEAKLTPAQRQKRLRASLLMSSILSLGR